MSNPDFMNNDRQQPDAPLRRRVFGDPVTYLAENGITSELVEETLLSAAA